jgi:phosphopantetheinyl transferase
MILRIDMCVTEENRHLVFPGRLPAERLDKALNATAHFARSRSRAPRDIQFVEGWRKTIMPADPDDSGSIAMSENRIAVWVAPVEQLVPEFLSRDLLGPEDQLISEQIRAAESRNCTVAGRVLLRVGLSHAVGGRINPRDWRFRTALNGKPAIAKGWPQFNFSISHTNTVAVVAISETLPIGIDVETIEEASMQDLVTTYCSSDEQLLFKGASSHQCSREFIRLWTLKEAYAKMVGFGHSRDFASIGVALDSLELSPDGVNAEDVFNTHFETMWVSRGRTLSHVSIAIGFPDSSSRKASLTVMAMPLSDGDDTVIHVPHLNI